MLDPFWIPHLMVPTAGCGNVSIKATSTNVILRRSRTICFAKNCCDRRSLGRLLFSPGLALNSVKAEILSCQRARKLLDGVGGGWVHQNHSSIKIFRLQDAVRPATPRQAVQSRPFDYPQSREALERRSIQTLQLAEATRSAPVIDTSGSQSVLLNKL